MSGLETGSLGPRTALFLIIFGHSMIVPLKPSCLSNGWKSIHDSIHCMTYWTMTWCGQIGSWYLRLLQKTMMSWSMVSHSPLHSQHRYLDNNDISELPDNVFSNLTSLRGLWVHACMMVYILLHALTNQFRNEFCNNTSTQNKSRLMSASHCTGLPVSRLLIVITTSPNSVAIYSLTRSLDNCDFRAYS